MKDDLFERLRNVDPATEERIAQEARALGNVPGRIAENEPSNERRFPRAVRRKATLVAVAAIALVAIALPLTLLGSLGDGETAGTDPPTPPDGSSNWVTLGTLADLRVEGVIYVPRIDAFVVAPADAEPLAFLASTDGMFGPLHRDRVLYCEPSHLFTDAIGNVFDDRGELVAGPGGNGMGQYEVRVLDGLVQVDALHVVLGEYVQNGRDLPLLAGPGCPTVNGVPLQLSGDPGFAIPDGAELPPIAVALPIAGTVVHSPIAITGTANVFEATVSIRVLDANGEVIAQAFTTATCGTGCRGDFSTKVEVPIDAEQPGTIQVFESSAQDGSMTNTVEIPVTLAPGLASPGPGVEGIWYDEQELPLPDGSPSSEGTVLVVFRGAEHCQWESASFMHLGWPVGTVANALADWRQYVRDPQGLFDDGALHVGFLSDTSLPSDAVDTGYHRGSWHLFVSPSEADDAVFVVNGEAGSTERWGRSSEQILCD